MATMTQDKPIRVGVFSTVAAADRAIDRLLAAGFTREQLTVVCSAGPAHEHFKTFEHQEPAGTYTPAATAAGAGVGAALGGLTAIAGAVATGGVALLAAGGIAAWTGGVVGGLVGAMMTRGVEKELANFYNQAVMEGKILVAAEDHGSDAAYRLATASRILAETGAEPIRLTEG